MNSLFNVDIGSYIELSYDHLNGIKVYEGEIVSMTSRYIGLRINEFDANGDIYSTIRAFHTDEIKYIKLISDNDFDLGI